VRLPDLARPDDRRHGDAARRAERHRPAGAGARAIC
jgi:hypothetical protein